jgi:integrase
VRDLVDERDNKLRLGVPMAGFTGRLRNTKTGPNKWFRVLDPTVGRMLRRHLASRGNERQLFAFSVGQLRYQFNKALAALGLSKDFVFHSLRHGGATHLYLSGWSVEDVLHAGRWAVTKSARHYIQAGPAVAIGNRISRRVAHQANLVLSIFPTLV